MSVWLVAASRRWSLLRRSFASWRFLRMRFSSAGRLGLRRLRLLRCLRKRRRRRSRRRPPRRLPWSLATRRWQSLEMRRRVWVGAQREAPLTQPGFRTAAAPSALFPLKNDRRAVFRNPRRTKMVDSEHRYSRESGHLTSQPPSASASPAIIPA